MRSRYGELLVAVRDSEERVRFLGYNPANIKLVAYVVAAGMAGLAGALFVPAVGIISPALIGIVPSIEFVIGVAVGGRAALLGPVLGAVAVAWAKSAAVRVSSRRVDLLQGLLFIVVVAFLPGGLASLVDVLRAPTRSYERPQARGPQESASVSERPPGLDGSATCGWHSTASLPLTASTSTSHPATCGSSSDPTEPARPLWSTRSPVW